MANLRFDGYSVAVSPAHHLPDELLILAGTQALVFYHDAVEPKLDGSFDLIETVGFVQQ
jgi:hypothetical protein